MPGRRFKVGPNIVVQLHDEVFREIRKTEPLEAFFEERGSEWVDRLNTELHAAQIKRKQPVADGYVHHIHQGRTRIRMYVVAATARAQAHEKAHSSILKLMETTKYDVKTRSQLVKAARKKASAAARKATRQARRLAAQVREPSDQ
jgi:hypothetical protein